MSYTGSRRFYYFLRRFTTLGGTAAYILLQTGIMSDEVTTAGVKSIVYILAGWVAVTLSRDYHKRATAKDNSNVEQLARATAVNKMIPWVIIIIIAAALKVGVANMFQHLAVISSMQIGGIIFGGFEMKYDLYIKRGITHKNEVSV